MIASAPVVILIALLFGVATALLVGSLVEPAAPLIKARPPANWRRWLAPAGLAHLPLRSIVLTALLTGLASALLTHLLVNLPLATVVALAGGPLAFWSYLGWRHRHRQQQRQEAIVEAILTMERALTANTTVINGIELLAEDGPLPLRDDFRRVVHEVSRANLPLVDALRRLRRRLADPIADDFIDSLIQAIERGGTGLARSLESLADQALAEQAIRREAVALQAGNQFSAIIVIGGIVLLFIVLRRLNPDYMSFYDEWFGQLLLAVSALGLVVAYRWMMAIGRLSDEARIAAIEEEESGDSAV